jgi:hypothetical protein
MNRRGIFIIISFFLCGVLCSPIMAQEVLRGEVMVELEPVYGFYIDEKYPLNSDEAYRRALEEGAMFFAASIYGWSFDYDIGEVARGIPEFFELSPLGEIPWGDPGLKVTHADLRDMRLWVWMDYNLEESQARRMRTWTSSAVRTAQAIGHGPLELPNNTATWITTRQRALEDAARAAVRAMLQGSERNRPKEARGYISLHSFPIFWLDAGRWACSARFHVEIIEIVPFAVH